MDGSIQIILEEVSNALSTYLFLAALQSENSTHENEFCAIVESTLLREIHTLLEENQQKGQGLCLVT